MEYLCDEELGKCKVPQLKQYLSKHGQFVGGKKAVLLERAKGIAIVKVKPVACLQQQDDNYDCVRREEKLVTPLGEVIPDPTSLKGWSNDLSSIPNFSETDIYNYLVLVRKAKRQLKSKVFYKDRHVHDVQLHPVSDTCTHCLVKCKVIPSLPSGNKKENPDYTVWTCLAKVSGNVLSADCNCTAGLGEACNHIGALLYALVDITDKKEDGLLACTSLKCSWNNPRKRRLSPKKAVDIFRGKESYPRDQGPDFHPTVDENRFRKRLLEKNSKAGWLTNFETDRNKVTLPQLDSVTFMYSDQSDLSSVDIVSQFQQHFALINVTDEQCAEIESVTRGQASNEMWKTMHHGRITSSNFGKVVTRKCTTAPDKLVSDLMGYKTFDNKFVKWGRDHEPAARRMYCNRNKGFSVKQCGLVVSELYPHLGASPDGLVHDPTSQDCDGLLEIKCPAADRWRHRSPHECATDNNFYCELDTVGNVVLKPNHHYYHQVQGQLAITNRKWCDFVVWTLEQPFSVERIFFNPDYWEKMLKKLTDFYVTATIPEMYTTRVLRGVPLYQ